MIAVRLERLDLPACSTASQIEPSAISESPQRTQTREGICSIRAAAATPPPIGRAPPRQPAAAGGDVAPGEERGGVACETGAELAEGQHLVVLDRPDRFQDRVVERRRVA